MIINIYQVRSDKQGGCELTADSKNSVNKGFQVLLKLEEFNQLEKYKEAYEALKIGNKKVILEIADSYWRNILIEVSKEAEDILK